MKYKVLCCSLCVLFCFSCFSLNSSAADVNNDLIERGWEYDGICYYLPDNVYDLEYYGAITLLAPTKNVPAFNPNKLPWSTAPQYVQDLIYMSMENAGKSQSDYSKFKMPFVCVRVTATTASVYVGYNIALGYDQKNNRMRICKTYNFHNNSVCYFAQYSSTDYSVKQDWQQLTATPWSDSEFYFDGVPQVSSFSSTLAYPTSNYDFYFYGGNAARKGDASAVNFDITSSSQCSISVDNDIGFQSGRFFYQDSSSENVYCEYFIPKTPEQFNQELQQEEVETSKSIWETLKSIPEMIGQKFMSLFIPQEGYFDTFVSDFQEYFSERLGVVYELPEAVILILQQLIEFQPLEDGYYIPIPEVTIPIRLEDGSTENFTVLQEQDYKFDFLSDGPFATLYEFYRAFCWLVCILGLISLTVKTYGDITGDG